MNVPKFDVRQCMDSYAKFNMAKDLYTSNKVQKYRLEQQGHFIRALGIIDGYRCEIAFTQNGKIVRFGCDCKSMSLCVHAGALLLKMNNTYIPRLPYLYDRDSEVKKSFNFNAWLQEQKREKQEKEELERQRRLEERRLFEERLRLERERREKERLELLQNDIVSLIEKEKEGFTSTVLAQVDTNIYQLYPEVFKSNRSFGLSYRIGTEQKKYVVKDISDMLRAFDVGDVVLYGKNFAIAHDKERLDDFSRQQLEFIDKVSHKLPSKSGRNIYIEGIIHDFYRMYKNQTFDTFSVKDVQEKVKMNLVDRGDYYTLTLLPDDSRVMDGNHMYLLPLENNAPFLFKRVLLDGHGKVAKFISICESSEQETLYINKTNWDDFYKYMIQPIENYIEIENLVLEDKTYMKIQFFADINNDEEIEGRLYYMGRNNEIRPGFNGEKLDYHQETVETIIKEYARSIENGIALFDSDSKRNMEFFSSGIARLSDICEVYISDVLKNLNKKISHTITVGVKVKNDLLSVDIQSVDIPKDEIAYVLSAYRRKKNFYRLKDGSMLKLDSEELKELDEFVSEQNIDLKQLKEDEILLDKNRMFTLDADSIVSKDETFKQILETFNTVSQDEIVIPEAYDTILRDYQKEGYRWLYTMHQYGFNGILADDMGLGKTLQVISLLEGIQSTLPSIVVCPASLVYNWEDEVHKFSKKLKVCSVVGNKNGRLDCIKNYKNYDLIVTSYDYIRRDQEDYADLEFEYIILDEAQYIKNKNTKSAASVKELKAKHRLALTGTPIENTLAELWSIFDFLMPGYLYNYHYFKRNFESPIVKGGNQEVSEKLRKMVSPFILRRNKKEVLQELPDKIENVQLIPFNEEENKLYIASLSQVNQQLQSMFDSPNIDQFLILAMLTRLRQLCIEPRLVYENITNSSSKLNALVDLLVQLKGNKQKVLVFSSFPSVFDYIGKELDLLHISYLTLTGESSKLERREMVEKFQNGHIDVFLISLKAGGTGLNLTAASAVIHIDPWWNVSSQNQATDRAYRIGQNNNVHVFKLVMKNSIEEKIVKLQEMKKELADTFVENNHGGIASMSKKEIIDLFQI